MNIDQVIEHIIETLSNADRTDSLMVSVSPLGVTEITGPTGNRIFLGEEDEGGLTWNMVPAGEEIEEGQVDGLPETHLEPQQVEDEIHMFTRFLSL